MTLAGCQQDHENVGRSNASFQTFFATKIFLGKTMKEDFSLFLWLQV
jgi:hypothetical protein